MRHHALLLAAVPAAFLAGSLATWVATRATVASPPTARSVVAAGTPPEAVAGPDVGPVVAEPVVPPPEPTRSAAPRAANAGTWTKGMEVASACDGPTTPLSPARRRAVDFWRRTLDDGDFRVVEWLPTVEDAGDRSIAVFARIRMASRLGGMENRVHSVLFVPGEEPCEWYGGGVAQSIMEYASRRDRGYRVVEPGVRR